MITQQQFNISRQYIFRHGRLLERKRFEYHFEGGSKEAVLNALSGYQNPDGGFGNGLEMDIMCPGSVSGAGEIALLTLEELNHHEGDMVDRFEQWYVTQDGTLPEMPSDLTAYPHGPWWAKPEVPDPHYLAIAGLLAKWDRGTPSFFDLMAKMFATMEIPTMEIYHYPFYYYLKYVLDVPDRETKLHQITSQLPVFLEKTASYHPLFFYLWWLAAEEVTQETLNAEAEKLVADFEPDGGIKTPYPQLPWWRPVWTLDALIHLKRRGFLKHIVIDEG